MEGDACPISPSGNSPKERARFLKGVLLAGVAFLCLMTISVLLLRLYHGKRYYRVFLIAFAVALGFYGLFYAVLPTDLGFLSPKWLERHRPLEFLNGILILGMLFLWFWDTFYTAVLTGFSSNLMVILAAGGTRSPQEVLRIYGAEKELDSILAWRLPKLLDGGYIEAHGAGYRIRSKGRKIGRLARFLQRLLTGSEEGG